MKSLCTAIIDVACFLELSDDQVVQSDAAVGALEQIASALQDASPEERQAFLEACAVASGGAASPALNVHNGQSLPKIHFLLSTICHPDQRRAAHAKQH